MYSQRRERERERWAIKISCHLASKVVIAWPFEGKKVEGNWKIEPEREFHRWEVGEKKMSPNQMIFALESSTQ